MSHSFTGGVFRAFDGATVAIDSSRQNMVVCDFKTGSFVIPQVSANGEQATTEVDLGAVNAAATDLAGQFRCTQSATYSGAGVVDGKWHQIGGTTTLFASYAKLYPDSLTTRYETYLTATFSDLAVYIDVTFYLSGGHLWASHKRFAPYFASGSSPSPVVSVNTTVTYFAILLSFDN